MGHRIYRVLTAFFALLAFIALSDVGVDIGRTAWFEGKIPIEGVVALLGFGFLLIAMVGLWNFRLWGFIALVVSTLLLLAAALLIGGYSAAASGLNFFVIVLTAVRYFFPVNKSAHA